MMRRRGCVRVVGEHEIDDGSRTSETNLSPVPSKRRTRVRLLCFLGMISWSHWAGEKDVGDWIIILPA